MIETLEKRLESEIRELDTKLKSLDINVQHHVRRREKVESLKSEVEKQENELAVQKSVLEAQQSETQKLLQDVEEVRQKLENEDSRIQTCRSVSDKNIGLVNAESRTRIDELQVKISRMETYIEQIIEDESGGNTDCEQSIQERLTDSTVKLQRLQTDFEQFKNNQLGELTGQPTNSLLGQMVEKLGHLVE